MYLAPGEGVEALGSVPGTDRLEVVLSNHLVRYALLPWSPQLTSSGDWHAYAQHVFGTTYGSDAGAWRIRICDSGRGKARVACAADASLLDEISAVERVDSIQPHLMAAFNDRRGEFEAAPGWFVLHEPGRLVLGLVADDEWKLVRSRQAPADWRESLPDLLHREAAVTGLPNCERLVLSFGLAA
ncbi:MAG: hypothetical protein WAO95_12660 [Burkholderiales bacterium]